MWSPYTYLIGWSKLNCWYYGSEYGQVGKTANPKNLWTTYFTSSYIVKNFRKEYGEPDVIEVRRTFLTEESCKRWERRVLKKMNVMNSTKWLNQNDKFAPPALPGNTNPFFGKKHSDETRAKMKQKAQERHANTEWVQTVFLPARKTADQTIHKSEEFRDLKRKTYYENEKIQKAFRSRKDDEHNGMFGKKHSAETLEKQRQVKIGKYDGENNPNYQRPHSLEAKLNISLARTGTMRIHRGEDRKYIKTVLFPYYEREGWKKGFKSY